MRTLLTLTLIVFTLTVSAQFKRTNPIGSKIVKILEDAKAIENLITNKKVAKQQLLDIEEWNKNGLITSETLGDLEQSYNNYSTQMNLIATELSADLKSVPSVKYLKGRKFANLLKDFSKDHFDHIKTAKTIYDDEWAPAFANASTEANSKGIIPIIVFLVEIGETLFTSIKEMIDTGNISKKNKDKLLSAGLDYALIKLENKLTYPFWEDVITSNPTQSIGEDTSRNIEARVSSTRQLTTSRTVSNTSSQIRLVNFNTQEDIKLINNTKQITIGEASLPLFETYTSLSSGDKFQVELINYSFAYFFYFDEEANAWQDPYGKSIVVGSNISEESKNKTSLPASNKFFEIVGDSSEEEFLILAGNIEISSKERTAILTSQKRGVAFTASLPKILNEHSIAYPNSQGSMISWNNTEQSICPIYIKIDKNTSKI